MIIKLEFVQWVEWAWATGSLYKELKRMTLLHKNK
jgi:hypothetical protein